MSRPSHVLEWSPGAAGPILEAEWPDLPWQAASLCSQTDPEVFFPEKGGSTREAKRVCRSCSVRGECLEYALENDERFGIWGGLSERERRRVKRETLAAPKLCRNQLHVMNEDNRRPGGGCLACKLAADERRASRAASLAERAARPRRPGTKGLAA